ncbi:hypothetical protein Anas_02360 [Armadillidium nasatum]|uniref:C2H2-type domain-containing protein n=1 Tax=Armadillidium nasatum TaxID=96803 RepID=A0A5N5TIA9_9CRUS|nr:hypothetical protein Anas_02360 [Armadillidium nasatum]
MNQTTVTVNPISNTTLTTNAQKAYKCETCSATFTEKLYFDLHKQTHHQKEMPVVQILMNPGTAHQVIPQPSPAHQGSAQIIIQEDQLASYKRAYGVEPQQVYTLAPVTQYQVITTNSRNGTQSIANQCDQCTASFIESNELEEHKKKHTGDGPFTCEDCHFTFMYKIIRQDV